MIQNTEYARQVSEGLHMVGPMVQKSDGAVLTCSATECSFNRQFMCLAPSITVAPGDASCDAYTCEPTTTAPCGSFVVTCMTSLCEFNQDLRCTARGVTFDRHWDHADCATFRT